MTFQHFTRSSRAARRHGSSVPGPLECRRRQGKRRLTLLSEGHPPSVEGLGSLWGFNGTIDKTQWQWEAPSTPAVASSDDPKTTLPDWLTDYQSATVQEWKEEVGDVMPATADPALLSTRMEESWTQFRYALRKASSIDRMEAVCNTFTHEIRRNLALGLVKRTKLAKYISGFFGEIRREWKKKGVEGQWYHQFQFQYVSFCWAVLGGIDECKVLRPEDYGLIPMKELLNRLSAINWTPGAQDLALRIIRATPSDQLFRIEGELLRLLQAWTSKLSFLCDFRDGRLFDASLRSTKSCQGPMLRAVQSLARFADDLPPHIMHSVIDHAINNLTGRVQTSGDVYTMNAIRLWRLIAVNSHSVREELLVKVWLTLDALSETLQSKSGIMVQGVDHHDTCMLLLDYLISEGKVPRADSVKGTLRHIIYKTQRPATLAILLKTLEENGSGPAMVLCFRILARLGQYKSIRTALVELEASGTRLPKSRLVSMIKDITVIDPRTAFEIFKLHPTLTAGTLGQSLMLEQFPDLVTALINDSNTSPDEIWNHIEKRFLLKLRWKPHKNELPVSSKKVFNQRIKLVYTMAHDFSKAACRSDRVAFRNVLRCSMWLQVNRVPLSREISRAINYAGIIRALAKNRWPGTSKALYILDIIQNVEAKEDADAMGKVLYHWRAGIKSSEAFQSEATSLLMTGKNNS